MKHGRIVRVTPLFGGPYITYIVAEEDAAKAESLVRQVAQRGARVEAIARASLKLLMAASLAPGEFDRAD